MMSNSDVPDANAVAVMAAVDALPKTFRRLVHEYGARIVTDTWAAGTRNSRDALKDLEIWRERRQEELLKPGLFSRVPQSGMPLACKNASE